MHAMGRFFRDGIQVVVLLFGFLFVEVWSAEEYIIGGTRGGRSEG